MQNTLEVLLHMRRLLHNLQPVERNLVFWNLIVVLDFRRYFWYNFIGGVNISFLSSNPS